MTHPMIVIRTASANSRTVSTASVRAAPLVKQALTGGQVVVELDLEVALCSLKVTGHKAISGVLAKPVTSAGTMIRNPLVRAEHLAYQRFPGAGAATLDPGHHRSAGC
jgi:hypothetical protein